jgi:hypothetical protein
MLSGRSGSDFRLTAAAHELADEFGGTIDSARRVHSLRAGASGRRRLEVNRHRTSQATCFLAQDNSCVANTDVARKHGE